MIKREKEELAQKSLNNKLIKVIIGVRRSGKSLLAHKILENKNYGYMNFDDERFIGVNAENLNDFLEALKEIAPDVGTMLLDEVRNVKGWELFVNRLKRAGYNLIVTGSNAKLLSQELATHLTGRHFSIELFPFSFGEFLARSGFELKDNDFLLTARRALLKKKLEKYLEQGGFPELFLIEKRLMENIVFLELKRRGEEIYYFDTKERREVDFAVKRQGKIEELIQVCFDLSNLETRDREIKGLLQAGAELACEKLLIITWDSEEEMVVLGKRIILIPLWKWLLPGRA